MGTMCLLGPEGDVTIGWTEEQEALMQEVITKKLSEGYIFFRINPQQEQVRIKSFADIGDARKVVITDKDAEALIRDGKIGIVSVARSGTGGDLQSQGTMRDPAQIAQASTVAVPRARGG